MSDNSDRPAEGLNPNLRPAVDRAYSESQHGSDPMATISVKKSGPAVWPIIWAIVTIGLILMTIWILI